MKQASEDDDNDYVGGGRRKQNVIGGFGNELRGESAGR
jgi:hypothetical protein